MSSWIVPNWLKPIRTFEPFVHCHRFVDEHRTYIPIGVNVKTLAWDVETEMYSLPPDVTENVGSPDCGWYPSYNHEGSQLRIESPLLLTDERERKWIPAHIIKSLDQST